MDPTENDPMLDAVNAGVTEANSLDGNAEKERLRQVEENEVKQQWKAYEEAREFDKEARAQYAIDRRYAAGTAQTNWAVSANLIGAFIDILVSFLYARNPDVSASKAARVDPLGTEQEDDFAKTIQLVVSSLWRAPSARLKVNCRSQVRSTLSVGVGWLKAIVVSSGTNIPQLRNELNDLRTNLAQIEALKAKLAAVDAANVDPNALPTDDPLAVLGETAAPVEAAESVYDTMSPEELDAERLRLVELETSVQSKLEVAIRKGLAVDFVAAEDMQVSLDVRDVTDHVNAGWNANAIYRPMNRVTSIFPAVTETDLKDAKCYYQRKQKDLQPLSDSLRVTNLAGQDMNPDEAEQYVAGSGGETDKGAAMVKVVELWDRETGHVKTMIEGLKKWAKPPYQPDYPSTRFYPYFLAAFYPVDGSRHPQSLAWRLAKLQDEYSSVRSSERLTRQRAVPGVLFNASMLDATDAAKIERSVHQEYVGIKPTSPDQPLRDIFTAKPVEVGDMRLFDTSSILADMERISGVQEALQQSSTAPKTATEAEIQQSGFASRTTADRDVLETMLSDLAHYTAEVSLKALDDKDATRIAGAKAFWPSGMAIDDLLTMVEVEIEAGTTGKPKSQGDKDAWGVVMPVIKETMLLIRQAYATGDLSMADALIALLQETMVRMGDETDVMRFVPKPIVAPPGMPGAPMPGMPGDPMAPGGMPIPDGGVGPGVQDPAGAPVNPELVDPNLQAPQLEAPVL